MWPSNTRLKDFQSLRWCGRTQEARISLTSRMSCLKIKVFTSLEAAMLQRIQHLTSPSLWKTLRFIRKCRDMWFSAQVSITTSCQTAEGGKNHLCNSGEPNSWPWTSAVLQIQTAVIFLVSWMTLKCVCLGAELCRTADLQEQEWAHPE